MEVSEQNLTEKPVLPDAITHEVKLSEEALPRESKVIFFIFMSLTIGGLIKHINKRFSVRKQIGELDYFRKIIDMSAISLTLWFFIKKIAYTPMLFVVGCLGGAYNESLG